MSGLLAEALAAWRDAREGAIAEIETIGAERVEAYPIPGARNTRELGLHIVEVSMMMVGELTREVSDFTRKPFPELLREHAASLDAIRDWSELQRTMRSTLEDGLRSVESAGEAHMLGPVRQFDGSEASRLSWLYHGVAQEMYHRGQLAHYARLLGREPALTKKIRSG